MTTFERRQRILSLLRERPGVRVPELASLLDVSEGTIRNDLSALEEKGALTRVRGGAVVREEHRFFSPEFAQRVQRNEAAKQWIAPRAADLVEDGDSILLDASSTVYHLVPYLSDLRNLTVLTSGIETGFALTRTSDCRVILLGGVLDPVLASVGGPLGERLLEGLNIKTAFVSASGFSFEGGLTEEDINLADLKRRMIRSARRVIALIDSSKFGKVDLAPFASIEQVSHIITDCRLSADWLQRLQQTAIPFTVCDESTVSAYTPHGAENGHISVGFANLSEHIPFSVDVRRGLERAAQEAGTVDLFLADNQLDGRLALEAADHLIAQGVDVAIEYQIDEKTGNVIMDRFRQANIPVIAVDIPMVGAIYFGVDNYRAGHIAGEALGHWLTKHWDGQFDRLLVLEEQRAGPLPASRIRGQIDGLQSVVGPFTQDKIITLDSGNLAQVSQANVQELLQQLPDARRLAVISFNDDAAVGAIAAARSLSRADQIIVVGQGADRPGREEMRRADSRLVGSTAYTPERYGEKLIDLARRIARRELVPPAVYIDHVFITAANIDRYYPD